MGTKFRAHTIITGPVFHGKDGIFVKKRQIFIPKKTNINEYDSERYKVVKVL